MRVRLLLVLIPFFGFFGKEGHAQEFLPVMHDTTLFKHRLVIDGSASAVTTSIYNKMAKRLIFGGEISDEVGLQTYQKQKQFNRVGGGFRFGVEYRNGKSFIKSKPTWGWMMSVSEEGHFSGQYRDHLFGLVFVGNESFLGKAANLGNLQVGFEQFLSVGAGLHDTKSKSFISLNAILPQNFFSFNLKNGVLDFSEEADRVSAKEFDGKAVNANKAPYFKGGGVALNFDFNISFGKEDGFNGVINLTGRNIGAYYLRNSNQTTFGGGFDFTGFSLQDLTSDNNILQTFSDSLNLTDKTNSKFRVLPGFLQFSKIPSIHSKHKVQSIFGVRMYLTNIYLPLVFAGIHYQPVEQIALGGQVAYGGYGGNLGGIRLGIYLNYSPGNWNIGIGSEDVLGAFVGNLFGYSALIRVGWKL